MGRKIRTILCATVVAGAVIAVPASAQAAPVSQSPAVKAQQAQPSADAAAKGYKRCPKGYFCLFTGKNGKGAMARFKRGAHDLGDFGMDNSATSVWNRTSKYVKVYRKTNYRGYMGYFSPGAGGTMKKADNKISSLKVAR
ncbi:peptidase inhibitor family I36 protein [Streptomyces abyssalis]|uniref:peptidase inhibitor family I36 protein n=1 Tax=Streptomyces abyssalis TaxID=933944 RepID=UPI00085BFD88|nr:peptidase inhibitor family I36 protein [Streptomyces abyssalis]